MKFFRSIFVLTLCLMALSACSEVRESLGMGRSTPDEFAVVDRPPLAMPPDYGLRPPTPGAARPQDVDPSIHANNVLFGANRPDNSDKSAPSIGAASAPSSGEQALLSQAGAEKANPDIRSVISRETAGKTDAPDHLVQDLLWWKKDAPEGTTVDAAAEAARIKAAQDAKQPINQTATPVIEKEKSGFLGL